MKQIVFATNNEHKLNEVRAILGDQFEVLSLKDIGFEGDIPETGRTLEENAAQKLGEGDGEPLTYSGGWLYVGDGKRFSAADGEEKPKKTAAKKTTKKAEEAEGEEKPKKTTRKKKTEDEA